MGNQMSVFGSLIDQSFRIPQPTVTEKNIPDQTGKVFIITGANVGVGFQVSKILYSVNGTVYLACRNATKANAAIEAIKAAHPASTGKLVYLHLDLGDLTTIKATADAFLAQESRLDWLNNNAGVMVPPKGSKTAQGHELQLGTNVLGHFLLTKLLTPVLKSTAAAQKSTDPADSVRVSWAGSAAINILSPTGGMQFSPSASGEGLDLLDHAGGDTAYGASKVGNWWLAHEFGRRHGDADAVLHTAYNPGNLKTELQRHVPWLSALVLDLVLLYPPVWGAYTELYAGFSPDLAIAAGDQGRLIIPWGRRATWNRPDVEAEMREGGGSEKLWDWCERETSQYI